MSTRLSPTRPLAVGHWGPLAAGLAALVSIAFMLVVSPLATSLPRSLGASVDNGSAVLVEKILWLLPVAVLVLLFAWRAPGVRAFATRTPSRLLTWGAGLGFAIAFYVFVRLVEGSDSTTAATLAELGFFENNVKDLLQVLAIACVGPVAEEFVFRGLIYRSVRDFGIRLSDRFGGSETLWRWVAIAVALAVSGYAFIQIHTGFAALYLVMASGYALLYELTGSLQSSSFAHSLNNAAVLIIAASQGRGFVWWVDAAAVAAPFLALGLTRLVGVLVRDDAPGVVAQPARAAM